MLNASEIEAVFESSLREPFPCEDCHRLCDAAQMSPGDLIPSLDWYFSMLAGYSSSATRLVNRTPEELATARELLSKDFFQHFPELEHCRLSINSQNTPVLEKDMRSNELARLALLDLLAPL